MSSVALAVFLSALPRPALAVDYNEALCVSNGKREEKCSATISSRSLLFKYATGRIERIKKNKIISVISKDESVRRGFIFTHVDRRYLYTIEFKNIDGDDERITIAFDNFELSKEFDTLINSK